MYRRRKGARRPRKLRVRRGKGFSGGRMIEKHYTFTMFPADQFITNSASGTAGGVIVRDSDTTSGNPPLITATSFGTPVPAASGMSNYYCFGVGIPFALVNLRQERAYTGLFDNYRINWVQVTFEFTQNSMSPQNGSNNPQSMFSPTIYAFVDRDDVGIPGSISAVQGRQGHKVWNFNNKSKTKFSIRIKPKVAAQVFNGDTVNPVGYQQGQGWQDCAYPENKYYGLKLWVDNMLLPATNAVQSVFRVSYTYNVSFKGALNEY